MSIDFSTDQAYFDNLETVTFTSVRLAGNQTASVTDAGFYPGATSEGAPSRGVYTKGTARFSIRVSTISSVSGAKPRDTITRSNGDVYTVLSANPGNITQTWQIDAVCLKIAADLDQTGVLKRAATAQDTTGRSANLTSGYTTVTSGINCRVQPTSNRAGDTYDRRTMVNTARAFLDQQVDARAKDIFVCDGVTWTVVSSSNPELLSELPYLELEVIL